LTYKPNVLLVSVSAKQIIKRKKLKRGNYLMSYLLLH